MEGLFDYEMPKDDSPLDETQVATIMLYYSKEELVEFKQLCKKGMQYLLPGNFKESNISDFLLIFLKKYYGNKSEVNFNGQANATNAENVFNGAEL